MILASFLSFNFLRVASKCVLWKSVVALLCVRNCQMRWLLSCSRCPPRPCHLHMTFERHSKRSRSPGNGEIGSKHQPIEHYQSYDMFSLGPCFCIVIVNHHVVVFEVLWCERIESERSWVKLAVVAVMFCNWQLLLVMLLLLLLRGLLLLLSSYVGNLCSCVIKTNTPGKKVTL